ncbi:c-type cytochrome [Bacteriovoracaceae bacterium]|nr:c-type cytochrome [Bacteriovoracaceae bacterium]
MKKEPGMAYNMKTLNKVFAVLSILFLISTIWIVLDDYIRPWKAVQIKGLEVKEKVLLEQIKEAEESTDGDKVRSLNAKIMAAKKDIDSKDQEVSKVKEKLAEVQKKIYIQNMKNGEDGSRASEYQFKYEHAFSHNHPKQAAKYKIKMDYYRVRFNEGRDQLKVFQQEEKKINNEMKTYTDKKTSLEKELEKLTGTKDLLLTSMKSSQKGLVWLIRNMPFIDYLDPTIKIHQWEVKNVTEDRYFQQVPRVDRCKTCHLFIDTPGFEAQEQPYKTHSKLTELAVGANSAHPAKLFGCSSCHQGESHKVFDFRSPEHTPSSKEQMVEWEKKYDWHYPHKKPQPMFPLIYTEASCVKCHQGVEYLPMANKLNEGKKLINTYGCYGCHKIEGYQDKVKPGPALKKIAAKVTKEFITKWVWNPRSFNEHAKMPSFFMQAHNSKEEFANKNKTEVAAMAEFLISKSEEYKPFMKYKAGDADKGKELIQTVGCIGCHQVEGLDEPWNAVKSRKGTYLTGTGSKVDPDWLVSWLKKPSHYQEDTIMPSFRLTDSEVSNIATYLLSLKNEKFAEIESFEIDKKLRDGLLTEYLAQFEPIAMAEAKLAKMTDHQRNMELGKRSVGKYGCYSCHNIDGFSPDRAPIGPELNGFGSKPLTQLGYGQQHDTVGHSRHEWLFAHLKQPSLWDKGVPKSFKDLNKMPNFYLKDDEIHSISTVILGLVRDYVPLAGQKVLNAEEKLMAEGKKVASKYNCYGCHKIDGFGGDILAAYDDYNMGPPFLMKQGHRVNSDWFYKFLKNVHPIRSYVQARMPSFNFSNDEINKLITYFNATHKDAKTFHEKPSFLDNRGMVKWNPGERDAAKQMWEELACTSCHTGGFNSEEAQAPNLHFAKKRLRVSWLRDVWLKDPTKVMDYSIMPNFWENGTISAVEGVLDDDPKKQINAMIKYLWEFGYDKSPEPFKK